MNPNYYGIVEMGFMGAVALGIGAWQLISLSREQARDRRDAARRDAEAGDSAAGAGHAIGEHVPDDR